MHSMGAARVCLFGISIDKVRPSAIRCNLGSEKPDSHQGRQQPSIRKCLSDGSQDQALNVEVRREEELKPKVFTLENSAGGWIISGYVLEKGKIGRNQTHAQTLPKPQELQTSTPAEPKLVVLKNSLRFNDRLGKGLSIARNAGQMAHIQPHAFAFGFSLGVRQAHGSENYVSNLPPVQILEAALALDPFMAGLPVDKRDPVRFLFRPELF
jgi:hypothetical protein